MFSENSVVAIFECVKQFHVILCNEKSYDIWRQLQCLYCWQETWGKKLCWKDSVERWHMVCITWKYIQWNGASTYVKPNIHTELIICRFEYLPLLIYVIIKSIIIFRINNLWLDVHNWLKSLNQKFYC